MLDRKRTPSDGAGVKPGCKDCKGLGGNGTGQERIKCLPGGFVGSCQHQKMQQCSGWAVDVLVDVLMQAASEGRDTREHLQAGPSNLTICGMIRPRGKLQVSSPPASFLSAVTIGKPSLRLSSATLADTTETVTPPVPIGLVKHTPA